MEDRQFVRIIKWVAIAVGVIILFAIFFPFTIISAGERGVVMNFGNVQEGVLNEGLHFRMPIVQSIKKINVRVQKEDVKSEAASKDLQDVVVDVVVNYHINPDSVNRVFQEVGDNQEVFERIVAPNTNEVVKASAARFTAEEIIQKRQELKDFIDKALAERLKDYSIVLDDVSLVNIDFSKEFNAAIEAKQVAEQEAKRAIFVAQRAEQEAQAEINRAEGASEAQRLQQETLTPLIVQMRWIEAWKEGGSKVPQVISGDSNSLLFQIPPAQ